MNEVSSELIRDIASLVMKKLGNSATPDMVKDITSEVVVRLLSDNEARKESLNISSLNKEDSVSSIPICSECKRSYERKKGNRAVIAAMGRNNIGIVAGLSKAIADCKGNIEDINQTIAGEFFTMMMVVDISNINVDFEKFKENLIKEGEKLGIKVFVQHERTFEYMHRV